MMEPIYQTGNEIVDRLSRIHITGNVIPQSWYRTICRETGKPYLIAIVILSDIVYWYRAAEVRDEGTGQLLGYRKRFKADLLQRSYQQIAEQFGITKRDATNAVVELEKLGVVRRVFRTLAVNGHMVPNVLFLELNVEVLERLTFPEEQTKAGRGGAKGGCPRFRGDISPKQEGYPTDLRDTSIPKRGTCIPETRETNTEITYKDYNTENPIDPIQSYQRLREAFKQQIDYPVLKRECLDAEELDGLVDIAVEVLSSGAETIRVNREDKPAELVKEQYRQLNQFHFQYVLDCLSKTEKRAKNIRAVMITALYNSVSTMGNYYGNLYRSSQKGG